MRYSVIVNSSTSNESSLSSSQTVGACLPELPNDVRIERLRGDVPACCARVPPLFVVGGRTGGGGGGSGGRIEILAPSGSIVINDTISAYGGDGGDSDFGDSGAGGGGGIVLVDATPSGMINASLGLFNVMGGSPGASLGGSNPGLMGSQGTVTLTP